VLPASSHESVRHVQIWWLVGMFCFLGGMGNMEEQVENLFEYLVPLYTKHCSCFLDSFWT